MTKREREVTDPAEILKILDSCKYLHLGLVDDGMPYVVPLNYGYTMEDGKLTIYMHGAVKGYKVDVIRKNPVCCFEMDCDTKMFEGVKACQYGMVYSSLIGRGTVTIVTDVKEKIFGLENLMKVQTGKDFEMNERLVSAVSIFKIDVSEYTAKRRPLPAAMDINHPGM